MKTSLVLAVSLAAFAVAPPGLADEGSTSLRGQADHAFDTGVAHYDAGRLEDARAAFLLAWRTKKTHDVAANLGLTELRLGLWRDAAEHLAFALETSPPTDATEHRRLVAERLAEARAKVAAYRVTSNVDGAEISVGGVEIGRTRAGRGVVVFAEPGPRTLIVALDDRRVRIDVGAAAGEARDVDALLPDRPRAARPARTVGPSLSPDASPGGALAPTLVLGAAGVIAIGIGTGLLVAAGARTDEADERLDELRATTGTSAPCPSAAHAGSCQAIHALRVEHDTFANVGTGMLIGGGVAVATAAVWYALDRPGADRSKASARVRVAPSVHPWGGGLVIGATH